MTAMCPPSLFLAPYIVEQDPSAILAGRPLGGVPGVTRPVEISDRGGGPVSQFSLPPSARWTETIRSPLASYFGTMASPLRNHRESQHILILV